MHSGPSVYDKLSLAAPLKVNDQSTYIVGDGILVDVRRVDMDPFDLAVLVKDEKYTGGVAVPSRAVLCVGQLTTKYSTNVVATNYQDWPTEQLGAIANSLSRFNMATGIEKYNFLAARHVALETPGTAGAVDGIRSLLAAMHAAIELANH